MKAAKRNAPGLLSLPVLFFLCVFLSASAVPAWADEPATISALRSWRAPDNTRLVLDLSAPLKYRLSPDSSPARIIIDLDDVRMAGPLALPAATGPLKAIRFEKYGNGQRLVIDTTVELSTKIFQLAPNEKYGQRLVIDLYDRAAAGSVAATAASTAVAANPATTNAPVAPVVATTEKPLEPAKAPGPDQMERLLDKKADATTGPAAGTPGPSMSATGNDRLAEVAKPSTEVTKKVAEPVQARPETAAPEKYDAKRYRNVIVAIDAGHGGEDPGAIGLKGTYEKDVTLAIARELEALFRAEPGITPVLTRTGDYFIPLQDRRRIARYQHKADIFVSVHADSAENRSAKGASVFALSLKGAGSATSRFARMLAERENRSDLIGGVAIQNDDDILRNVLADMVVAGSLDHSLHMGRNILAGLDGLGDLHSRHVEQAGFAVLKEPGMVSLLVETGFISNPSEEKKLTNKQNQREIAEAIFNGVRRYCEQYPAPGTYFAWRADKDRGGERVASVPTDKNAADKKVAESGKQATRSETAKAPRYVRHKVERGENLTRLAAQYQVPMQVLRETNSLRDDNVKIGQVLKIPVN